jgi:UDP-N-acetylglucosamine 2-epimerase (non-hydrolysing)/GDP/UDP-N,N'-diacetylbacillosamine 2-epimerase (hydrolysing)
MGEADVIIGNSSSGLTEAPAMKKVTVNIGDRQKGRLKAKSVIDTPERSQDIVVGIHQGLSEEFQWMLPSVKSLYGTGNVSQQIKEKLKSVTLQTQKAFFDIEHNF